MYITTLTERVKTERKRGSVLHLSNNTPASNKTTARTQLGASKTALAPHEAMKHHAHILRQCLNWHLNHLTSADLVCRNKEWGSVLGNLFKGPRTKTALHQIKRAMQSHTEAYIIAQTNTENPPSPEQIKAATEATNKIVSEYLATVAPIYADDLIIDLKHAMARKRTSTKETQHHHAKTSDAEDAKCARIQAAEATRKKQKVTNPSEAAQYRATHGFVESYSLEQAQEIRRTMRPEKISYIAQANDLLGRIHDKYKYVRETLEKAVNLHKALSHLSDKSDEEYRKDSVTQNTLLHELKNKFAELPECTKKAVPTSAQDFQFLEHAEKARDAVTIATTYKQDPSEANLAELQTALAALPNAMKGETSAPLRQIFYDIQSIKTLLEQVIIAPNDTLDAKEQMKTWHNCIQEFANNSTLQNKITADLEKHNTQKYQNGQVPCDEWDTSLRLKDLQEIAMKPSWSKLEIAQIHQSIYHHPTLKKELVYLIDGATDDDSITKKEITDITKQLCQKPQLLTAALANMQQAAVRDSVDDTTATNLAQQTAPILQSGDRNNFIKMMHQTVDWLKNEGVDASELAGLNFPEHTSPLKSAVARGMAYALGNHKVLQNKLYLENQAVEKALPQLLHLMQKHKDKLTTSDGINFTNATMFLQQDYGNFNGSANELAVSPMLSFAHAALGLEQPKDDTLKAMSWKLQIYQQERTSSLAQRAEAYAYPCMAVGNLISPAITAAALSVHPALGALLAIPVYGADLVGSFLLAQAGFLYGTLTAHNTTNKKGYMFRELNKKLSNLKLDDEQQRILNSIKLPESEALKIMDRRHFTQWSKAYRRMNGTLGKLVKDGTIELGGGIKMAALNTAAKVEEYKYSQGPRRNFFVEGQKLLPPSE